MASFKRVLGLEFTEDDRDRRWCAWRRYDSLTFLLEPLSLHKFDLDLSRTPKQRHLHMEDSTWMDVVV